MSQSLKNSLTKQCVSAFMLMCATPALAADSPVEAAKSLIAQQRYQEAYQLLAPLESDMSGSADYDYLLGTAGVESGHVTRGLFALERVLAQQPNNTAARAEIAKAHFKLGEADNAKHELGNVLQQDKSPEMTNAVNSYMNAIDKAMGLTTTFNAYLDFGLGYDSNINSATSANSLTAPGISPGIVFNLSTNSKETSDGFYNMAAGISFRKPVSDKWSVFAGANFNNRLNMENDLFDQLSLDANLGMRYKYLRNTVSVAYQTSLFQLNGERFRNIDGLSAQWQNDLDLHNQISAYGQYARISYKTDFRDADRYVLGGGWAHLFQGDQSPVLFAGGYLGKEDATHSAADFMSYDLYGVRAGGQLSFTPKWVGYASAGYEKRNYDKRDPVFLKTRDDDQYELTLGANYLPSQNWLIKPQFSYINNRSNIVIDDYSRYVFSINIRRDFNW